MYGGKRAALWACCHFSNKPYNKISKTEFCAKILFDPFSFKKKDDCLYFSDDLSDFPGGFGGPAVVVSVGRGGGGQAPPPPARGGEE